MEINLTPSHGHALAKYKSKVERYYKSKQTIILLKET